MICYYRPKRAKNSPGVRKEDPIRGEGPSATVGERGGGLLGWLLLLVLVVGTIAVRSAVASQGAEGSAESFEFALIGDLGYTLEQEPLFDNVMADLNAVPSLAFVVHDGDLSTPRFGCSDEFQAGRLSLFNSSVHPLIYTPGDNEWTDCWQERAGGFDPLEKLARIRQVFFSDQFSLGQRTLTLTRQSETEDPALSIYRENARWTQGEITFLTLHVTGSNNNLGVSHSGDVEYAARNAANVVWLREGFEHARENGSRGLVIIQQANPRFERAREDRTGFNDVLDALTEETIGFGKSVVLVHGDTHYFRVDKPLVNPANGRRIESFTRVETFGQPDHHWVHVSVDYTDPNLFVFRPRIVEQNLVDHR